MLYRAAAKVKLTGIKRGERWEVGFIQACANLLFETRYGSQGVTRRELHPPHTGILCSQTDISLILVLAAQILHHSSCAMVSPTHASVTQRSLNECMRPATDISLC